MKKYGILSILFLLLSLAGGLYLVKTNQDNRNKAASSCWATCNCSCGKSFCADPKGKGCNSECNEACGTSSGGPTSAPVSGDGCNGPLSASACKGVNPGSSCTGGFDGTCKRTTDNNCACVANNPTAGGPTSTKPKVCTEGNLGTLCCNSSKVACQQHRYADCSTTCTDNCGIFNNSACTPPSGVTPTYIPGGGGVTWSCNAMSGTRGGYNCSGYQNCGGYRSGTPCDPGEYIGGGLQAPIDAKTCQCSNGVWVVGKGATCDGLCACTNNVCVNCSPTPPNKNPTATPTKKPTSTPTKTPSVTPTKTPSLTPTKTPSVTPSPTPGPSATPTPTNSPTPTPTLTPTPTPVSPPNNCGGTCGSNVNCGSDLFCHDGFCRSPSCPDQTNCICQQNPTSTPIPTRTPTNTPVPTSVIAEGPSPTRIILPQSGVEFPAQMLAIFGGIVTLLGFLILL